MATWLVVVLPLLPSSLAAVLVWQVQTANRRQAVEQAKEAKAQAERAAKLDERKADRDELQSALDFWKTSFDAVTLDNRQLRAELDAERGEHRKTRTRVDRLERTLRRAGIPVPNGANGSGDAP